MTVRGKFSILMVQNLPLQTTSGSESSINLHIFHEKEHTRIKKRIEIQRHNQVVLFCGPSFALFVMFHRHGVRAIPSSSTPLGLNF